MITKWTLANFKSFLTPTTLGMAPLTLFVGANSSGKSSILQSILLISQTLSSKVGSRSVVLNGPLVRLGQFDDLRSFGSNEKQIEISLECKSPAADFDEVEAAQFMLAFDVDPSSVQRELMQLQPQLVSCHLKCTKKIDLGDEAVTATQGITLTRATVPQTSSESAEKEVDTRFRVELPHSFVRELKDEVPSAEVVSCTLNHFLPSRLLIRFDQNDQVARTFATALGQYPWRYNRTAFRGPIIGGVDVRNLEFPPDVTDLLREKLGTVAALIFDVQPTLFGETERSSDGFTLRNWQDVIRRMPSSRRTEVQTAIQECYGEIVAAVKGDRPPVPRLMYVELPETIVDGTRYIDDYFTRSVKYLGPLRDEPKPLYPLATTVDPFDVGLRGEFTAAVLDLHRAKPTRYHHPSKLNTEGEALEPENTTLELAVLEWVQYLGVAEGITTLDRGKIGHELKVRTKLSGKPNDLTHVGVGVSQVLPILVMCLLADPDTTLILEQPELHLHPSVQTLLADFFLSMARLGKQCLIETHSEYIINRLRLRAARSLNPRFLDLVRLYFVEPAEGTSSVREVVVNEYGAINDWPSGFFDESQREAEDILRAAVSKRKRERIKT